MKQRIGMHLGCDIYRHETQLVATKKKLYSISGRYIKQPISLPFLTSFRDALDWIDREDRKQCKGLGARPSDTEPEVP